MKKEELLEIGLTEEQAAKVFSMNWQDVEREKAKTTAAKADLADAQGKLSAAQTELDGLKKAGGDMGKLQQQLTDLQAKYDKDTGDLRGQLADRDYSDAITRAITGKGLKFSSKSAAQAFTDALKKKKLELKEGEINGFDDFVKSQRDADPDAFAPDKAPPRIVGPMGGGGNGEPPKPVSRAAQLAAQHHASLYGETKKE